MKEEFPGQKNKEKAIKTLRKNSLTLTKNVLKFLGMLLISVLVMTYLGQLEIISPIANYINIIGLLGIIFSLSYGFYTWTCWYYDVYILTSERVIEVEQKGLFNREVREIGLEKIQDVTYNVSGLFSTAFEIGNVKIHSASGMQIELKNISKPSIVREVLMKLVEKKSKTKKDLSADEIAEALAKRMAK